MGPERVVFGTPSFDDHLSLPEGAEDLPIEHLVSGLPVEAFSVPVSPQAPWFDEEGKRMPEDQVWTPRYGEPLWDHGIGD